MTDRHDRPAASRRFGVHAGQRRTAVRVAVSGGGDGLVTQRPTAKAVARLAEVSVTTVSRVLSGRDVAIAEQTRRRVLSAAEQLKYRPNSLAVALRKGSTRTVGLVVPDIADAYFHQVARGLEDAAQASGYMVVVCNTDRVPARERAVVELLADQQVDAIVLAGGGVDQDEHLRDSPWNRVHVVAVGPRRLGCPAIRVDDAGAIELAVRHLQQRGCQRVLCLAGRENWLITDERLAGYRRATSGGEDDLRLVRHGGFTLEDGHALVQTTLDEGVEFDGVVAFNDYTAIGAMKALSGGGLRVPEDVLVVGCGDIPVAALVSPSLTSVSAPQYEFGRAALQIVLDLLAGRDVPPVTTLPHHLRVRASTTPARCALR